jgi:pyruvate kinase
VTLYRGVYPISFHVEHDENQVLNHKRLNKDAIDELCRRGVVRTGDIVIITKGDLEERGSTNALKIIRVGDKSPNKDN